MSSYVAKAQLAHVTRRSIARLRDVVRTGGLRQMAAVDPHTGEVIDTEARALFSSLPTVSPATSPEELVPHDLLASPPPGLAEAAETPKYRVGRRVFVRTTVSHTSPDPHQAVGSFHPAGAVGFTHRARLARQRGDNFLVELAGADRLLPFAKSDIFTWNEPTGVAPSGGSLSGVHIDYGDARMRAFVCAGYLEIADELKQLDFGAPPDEVQRIQARLVHRLASAVDMRYPGRGDGYVGSNAGSLIGGGRGVCFVQRAVAAAYLGAFARVLNFEIQVAVGKTLRLGAPRGFLIVTLLPSMERYVCDPAWSEPLTDLQVAFFGPGWGHDRRLEAFEGDQNLVVRPAQVDVPFADAA